MYKNCHNDTIQRYSHKLITIRLDKKDNTLLCYFLFAVIFNTSRNNLPFSRLHTQKPSQE